MRAGPLTLSVLMVGARSGSAQLPPHHVLEFTISVGAVSGSSLWALERQVLCVWTYRNQCTDKDDTVRLSRTVRPGLVAGLQATYYPAPRVGLQVDASYLSLPFADACTGIFFHPDPHPDTLNYNPDVCASVTTAGAAGGAVGIFVGAVVRGAPARRVNPYLRASAGIVSYSRSFVDVSGHFVRSDRRTFLRPVLNDPDPTRSSASVVLGGGVTVGIGPAHRLRGEIRDVVTRVQRAVGPADRNGQGPTVRSRLRHHLAVAAGLDVVLERKRPRRF
ncbi:MAG: hypothetical protein HYS40_06075 [Gemmatimonadetes bacterium]|nr:hypothetical protein [Gemmatimonadota bacterium]